MRSVPRLIVDIEQRSGITREARIAAIDGLTVGVVAIDGLLVESAHENRLHGAISRTCVGKCADAGRFEAKRTVSACETKHALRAPQPFHDAIAEELLDEIRAGRAYRSGLFHAPLPIMSEELARIARQVI